MILAAAALWVPSPAEARPDILYRSDLSVRAGYHFFNQSSSWLKGKEDIINKELFFREESDYRSDNVNTALKDHRTGMTMISIEWIAGIKPDRLPFCGGIESFRGFRGFRAGFGFSIYAFTSMDEEIYSGPVTYVNNMSEEGEPAELGYTGSISFSEKIFSYIPGFSLSYFHEEGISGINELIPYGGIELSVNFLNGERKLNFETDTLYLADGSEHDVEARIQESFYNALSFRAGLNLGVQYNFSGPHSLDLRCGWIYNETSVSLSRTGAWTESINGASYSRRVSETGKPRVYSQTGFFISLGYSVGLS
jgi:hypothetical protein